MNDHLNQPGLMSHSQDGCQTNSRRYDSRPITTGPVRSAIPSNSWASCLLWLRATSIRRARWLSSYRAFNALY